MDDDKLGAILEKKRGFRGQSMVSLDEMEVLLEYGGKIEVLNKEAGMAYCHIVNYEEREFFSFTGGKVCRDYDYNKNVLYVKNWLDRL